MGILDRIKIALSGDKEIDIDVPKPIIEELGSYYSINHKDKVLLDFIKEELPYETQSYLTHRVIAETLYINDYLVKYLVDYTSMAVSEGEWFLKSGDTKARDIIKTVLDNSDLSLNDLIYRIIKDNYIYGCAIFKWGMDGDVLRIVPLNPKHIDLQRDEFGMPLFNKRTGLPKGYVVIGESTLDKKKNYKYNQIIVIKLFDDTPFTWDIPPLYNLYEMIKIRRNIEDVVGKASWWIGMPTIVEYVGNNETPASVSLLKERQKAWKAVRDKYIRTIVLPHTIKLDTLKASEQYEHLLDALQYSISMIASIFNYPKSLLLGITSNRAVIQEEIRDYYRHIDRLRSRVTRVVKRQLFASIIKNYRSMDELPDIEFSPTYSGFEWARALSTLAKYGIVTHDNELEDFVRNKLGLPLKSGENE